jgi:hypothetical protein
MRLTRLPFILPAILLGPGTGLPVCAQQTANFMVEIPKAGDPSALQYYYNVQSVRGMESLLALGDGRTSGPGTRGRLSITEPLPPAAEDDFEAWAARGDAREVQILFYTLDPATLTQALAAAPGNFVTSLPGSAPVATIRLHRCRPSHWSVGLVEASSVGSGDGKSAGGTGGAGAGKPTGTGFTFQETLDLQWDGVTFQDLDNVLPDGSSPSSSGWNLVDNKSS